MARPESQGLEPKGLFSRTKTTGVVFPFSRQRLNEVAQQRGCHHMANLNGCPA